MKISGQLTRRLRNRFLRLLAGLSGLLTIQAIARFVGAYLLGYRRPCSARLEPSGIVVEAETRLLGRKLSTRSMHISPWKVERVEREDRFRQAHLLVGGLFFLLGAGAGFGLLVEWAWTRFGVYLILGLIAIVLGIAVDLAVVLLVPTIRTSSAVIIVTPHRRLRIEGVADAEADAFIAEVERWFEENRQAQGGMSAMSKRE